MLNGMRRASNVEQSGLSTERLALDVATILQGSEFYETDTTARYKFYSGAWAVVVTVGGASSYSFPTAGGGGGGGAVTIANGADITQGAMGDAVAATDTGSASMVALTKRLLTKIPPLGQALKAASLPVVMASDSAFPIAIADGADVTQGAKADAVAATDTGDATLVALTKRLNTKIPPLGQALKAASLPVVMASDSAFPVTVANGADATQGAIADPVATTDTGNWTVVSLLKRLLTKTPPLGQALKAASLPVTLASDQGGIPTTTFNPATIVVGQVKIAASGTAVQIPAAALSNGLIVKSLATNSPAQTVGASGVTNVTNGTGNGYILLAGEAGSFGVANASALWVNGTAGDIFTYEGN